MQKLNTAEIGSARSMGLGKLSISIHAVTMTKRPFRALRWSHANLQTQYGAVHTYLLKVWKSLVMEIGRAHV